MWIARSVARVADQRLLPAAEHDENHRRDPENNPGRQVEAPLHIGVPSPQGMTLYPLLHEIEAVLVDDSPRLAEFEEGQVLIDDGFFAVIDEENESHGQQAKSDETKQESDHVCAG